MMGGVENVAFMKGIQIAVKIPVGGLKTREHYRGIYVSGKIILK